MVIPISLQALLLDVDGTLADTEGQGHLPAFNDAFRDYGLPHRWEEATYRQLLAEIPGGRERLHHALARRPPTMDGDLKDLARQLHAAKNRHYAERLRTGCIPPRPGVERLLSEAHDAGVRLAVVTTSAYDNVAALFDSVLPAARARFETLICGEDVAAKKPDPEAYRLALERLDLQAADCLAIEDSANGLRAARAAGIPTLVTRSPWTRHEDFTGAAAVVDHLDDRGDGQPLTLKDLAVLQGQG
ncbi:MAG: HAD-IA family hydrolase [Halorhodospira sp.]